MQLPDKKYISEFREKQNSFLWWNAVLMNYERVTAATTVSVSSTYQVSEDCHSQF